jgi:plasmid stability protein
MALKTTLELPDDLMRRLRVQAAESGRRLKDVVTELIERGLDASNDRQDSDPLQAWLSKFEVRADGTVVNPDGVDAPDFERALEVVREENRQQLPRAPSADGG